MAQVDENALKQAILENKLLDEKTLNGLAAYAQSHNSNLLDVLFEKAALQDSVLGGLAAKLYGVGFVDLSDVRIPETLLEIVPYALAAHQHVIPFRQTEDSLEIALNDPSNDELINSLENKTGMKVVPFYATEKDIQLALKAYNSNVNEKFKSLLEGAMSDPNDLESLKDASKIVDTIILFAFQSEASDIHVEPHKTSIIVRYRIDGILHVITDLPIQISELLVTRIKVLANLRTDEHRASQDGRFKIDLEGNEITLRVSILPTYDGEKIVMRLLTSSKQSMGLESFGYSEKNMKLINNNITKTHGMLLVTGPTGSGKTTTLYTMLRLLNTPEVNISTIEDPIEYRLDGINQTQVNVKTDLTFENGLRSLVRQDPDIIMVGEIRDEATASVAINAALTGHLVLATLHTNDAASTLPRMIEMGVESFLLAATAEMVIAQRLVRKICEKCKKPYQLSFSQLSDLGERLDLKEDLSILFNKIVETPGEMFTFYKGEGCEACGGSGFKGRTAIAEVMDISDGLRKHIVNNTSPNELQELAHKEGMVTMYIDGMLKVLEGVTTIEEVLRVMKS